MPFLYPLQSRFALLKRARAEAVTRGGAQRLEDLGGPWAIVEPNSKGWFPSQNLNRVIDLADMPSVEPQILERCTTLYEKEGLPRHFLYLDPCADLEHWYRVLVQAGYRLGNEVSVLVRPLAEVPQPRGSFAVRRSGLSDQSDIQRVLGETGQHEISWQGSMAGILSEPKSAVFLAYDGDSPVAVAAVTCHRGVAYLSNAATVPEHRRKGAQRQLIEHRLGWAAGLGCDIAFVETYRFLASSFANLQRCGFEERYQRLVFRYESDRVVREGLENTLHGHQPPPTE